MQQENTNPTATRPGFLHIYIIPILFVVLHMGAIYVFSQLGRKLFTTDNENFLTLASIALACAIVSPIIYVFLRARAKKRPETLLLDPVTKNDWIQTVGWSFIGINVARLLIIVFAMLAVMIGPLQKLLERYMGLSDILAGQDVPLWLLILATTIFGPLAEELVYRGVLMGAFREAWGDRLAIIFSALIFAIVHMDVIQSTYAFVLGLILGYIYMKTRNLWCAYIMHAIVNFLGGPVAKIFHLDTPERAVILLLVMFVLGIIGLVMVVTNNSKQKKEAYLKQQQQP